MAEVRKTKDVDVDADELWARIGDFEALNKFLTNVEPPELLDGGKTRRIVMGPSEIIERLVETGDRSYTYTMDAGGPMPVKSYRSTISVEPTGEGKSTVTWAADFEPADGTPEEMVVQIINGVYDSGLAQL